MSEGQVFNTQLTYYLSWACGFATLGLSSGLKGNDREESKTSKGQKGKSWGTWVAQSSVQRQLRSQPHGL